MSLGQWRRGRRIRSGRCSLYGEQLQCGCPSVLYNRIGKAVHQHENGDEDDEEKGERKDGDEDEDE